MNKFLKLLLIRADENNQYNQYIPQIIRNQHIPQIIRNMQLFCGGGQERGGASAIARFVCLLLAAVPPFTCVTEQKR